MVSGIPHHQKIAEAFEEFGHEHLAPVFEVFEGEVPYDDLRLVRVAMIGAR